MEFKIEHTRPFNLEHARAGAPYGCIDGYQAKITTWDARGGPLLGYIAGEHSDYPCVWNENGVYKSVPRLQHTDSLVMLPLGYIDGKPVHVDDDLLDHGRPGKAAPGNRDFTGCTWPALEPVYPETKMTVDDLNRAYSKTASYHQVSLKDVANAAIRHAIDAGQVMLPGGEMRDDDILEAFEKAGVGPVTGSEQLKIINAVKSLMVTEPEVEQLREDLKRESRDLGVAERKLEAMGYRRANGVWVMPAHRELVPAEMLERVARAVADRAYDQPAILSDDRLTAIIEAVKAGRV